MITILSDEEPVPFRVIVVRGVVSVEEATLTWRKNNTEY